MSNLKFGKSSKLYEYGRKEQLLSKKRDKWYFMGQYNAKRG
jgi:hypothetical protein